MNREFPHCLRQANISPSFKKDDSLDKENYRPVSILPLLSSAYKNLHYNQLSDHVEINFNHTPCGFSLVHSTQQVLLKLLQSWQRDLNKKCTVVSFNRFIQAI